MFKLLVNYSVYTEQKILPRLHGAKIRDRDPDRNPDPE